MPDIKNTLSFRERFGYASSSASLGLWNAFVSTFLLYFYTNVAHLRPAAASTIISLAVIWDAVNDPLFASLADNHHFKNGEKMRPFLLACVPLAVCLVLMFTVYGSTGGVLPVVMACVTYFLYRIPSTLYTLALNGTEQLCSPVDVERVSVGTWSSGGGAFGSAISSLIFWPIIRAVAGLDAGGNMLNARAGFFAAACIAGALGIAGGLFNFFTTKERVHDHAKTKLPFLACFRVLLTNRAFLLNLGMLFFASLFSTIISGYALYYCTYVINRPGIVTAVMATYILGIAITLPFVNRLYRMLGSRRVIFLGAAALTVGSVVFLLFSKKLFAGFVLCGAIGIGMEFVSVMLGLNRAALTDEISKGQGTRMDGMLNNVMSFVQKLGIALLTFLLGIALEFSHFDGSLTVQPASAVTAIVLIMGITCAAASAGIWLLCALLRK